MSPKPWQNKEGYHDPTAFAAQKAIEDDEKRISSVVGIIKAVASVAGLEIASRIEFRDIKTGKYYL